MNTYRLFEGHFKSTKQKKLRHLKLGLFVFIESTFRCVRFFPSAEQELAVVGIELQNDLVISAFKT